MILEVQHVVIVVICIVGRVIGADPKHRHFVVVLGIAATVEKDGNRYLIARYYLRLDPPHVVAIAGHSRIRACVARLVWICERRQARIRAAQRRMRKIVFSGDASVGILNQQLRVVVGPIRGPVPHLQQARATPLRFRPIERAANQPRTGH